MLWTVKRLYTILIVLVLWEDTNGFGVWNSTSVGYWQAGHPDTIKSSNAQLSTGVEPFKLLARKGANRNVGRGNSSSALLNSEDQTAQHDSSFAQFSSGITHDESIQYARSQASTTIQGQEKLQSQPLSFYRFEFPKPDHYGVLLSQPQSAATTNQAYGSQSQSSYQPSTTTLALAGQFASTSPAKPSSDYIYQAPTYGGPLSSVGPSIPSCFQSEVSTSKLSGIKTQSLYQPTSQAQPSGGYKYPASTFGKPLTSLHTSIPSSSQAVVSKGQLSEIQTQSVSTSQAQPSGFYTYPSATFGKPLTSLGLSIPASSQSALFTGQLSGFPASYQPSTATQDLASLSSTAQAQPSGGYMNQAATFGKPLTSLHPSILSSSQVAVSTGQLPGIQTQFASTSQAQPSGGYMHQAPTSGRPLAFLDTSVPAYSQGAVSTGQLPGIQTQSASTSQAQPSGGYMHQAPTSGRPLAFLGASVPACSQGAVSTGQLTGIQTQASYLPSTTTQDLASLSSTAQAQPFGGYMNQAATSGKPLTSLGLSSPSSSQSAYFTGPFSGFQSLYPPTTTTHALAGQSASTSQAQPSGGYTDQALTSGRPLTNFGTRFSSSSHPAVSTGQFSGIQAQPSYKPSTTTQDLASLSVSTSQAQPSGGYTYPASTFGKPLTSMHPGIPSSSQSAVSTGQFSGFQASYQPSTTTPGLAGQSAFTSKDQLSDGYTHPAPTSSKHPTSLGQSIPSSSQVAVSTGRLPGIQTQSASTSLVQPSGFYMYPAATFGKPLTSLGLSIPSSSQSAVFTSQLSGIRASYLPSSTTQDLASLSSTAQAQSSGGYMHQAPTSGRLLTTLGTRIPYSSQPAVSTGQFSGIQTQPSYKPTTTTQDLASLSASTAQDQSSGDCTHQAPTSGRPLTSLHPSMPSSSRVAVSTGQFSGFQTQASYQPSIIAQALAGQFASTSHGLPAGGYMHQAPIFGQPLTSLGQIIPASSQSAVFTGQLSGIQASNQPSTTTQDLASLYSTSQAQSSGGYTYQAPTSGRPLTFLGSQKYFHP